MSLYQNLWQLDSVYVDKNVEKLATWACETTTWGDPKPIVEPKIASITMANSDLFQSQLIKLEDVQFFPDELGETFADSEDEFTPVNRTLMDCEGDTIIVRTSGFANFADEPIPEGKGSLIAVVSRYRDEFQLLLRDYNEIDMDGARCEDEDDDTEIITIQELRDLFDDGTTTIPSNVAVKAVVISDRENANLSSRNAVIMDDSGAGIALRFVDNHDLNLGASVRINVGTLQMESFNGLLQISDIPNGNAVYLGSGTLPEPIVATVGEVIANTDEYESKLVTFTNATITGGSTFAVPDTSHGSLDLSDGTGTITLFTYNWAEFAGESVPVGEIDITGIVSVYNDPQFLIRNMNDIVQ